MLTLICIVTVYVIGWIASIPYALRNRMEEVVCNICDKSPDVCQCKIDIYRRAFYIERTEQYRKFENRFKPRGLLRKRTDKDAAFAIGVSLLWPPCAILVLTMLAWDGIRWLLFRVSLTESEKERINAERLAEIERLTRQIREE